MSVIGEHQVLGSIGEVQGLDRLEAPVDMATGSAFARYEPPKRICLPVG